MFDPDKYLTVHWQMGGRVYPILDCYGLVHEVRRDLGLPYWPAFEGVTNADGDMDRTANAFRENVTRCQPAEGAVVACYSGGAIVHLGIVIDIGGVLHVMDCNEKKNVTILPIPRFERHYVKVEYYR